MWELAIISLFTEIAAFFILLKYLLKRRSTINIIFALFLTLIGIWPGYIAGRVDDIAAAILPITTLVYIANFALFFFWIFRKVFVRW